MSKTTLMQQISSQWRVFAVPVVGGVFVIISLVGFFIPKVHEILSLREEYSQEEKRWQTLIEKRRFLEDISQADWIGKIEVVHKVIPNSKPVFEFLQVLQAQATRFSVNVSKYEFTPGKVGEEELKSTKDNVQNLEINLNVVGKVLDVNQFVRALEEMTPLASVEKVQTSTKKETVDGEPQVEAAITVLVYYAPFSMAKEMAKLPVLADDQKQVLNTVSGYFSPPAYTIPVATDSGTLGRTNIFSFGE